MRNLSAMTLLLLLPLTCGGCSSDSDRLKGNIDRLQFSIMLEPFDTYKPGQVDPGGGLRSVMLYTSNSLIIENGATGPDGRPGWVATKVNAQEMLGVIEELERSGLLKDAEHYYSEAVANPESQPPAAKDYRTYKAVRPSCIIRITSTTKEYHHDIICTVPWGKETLAVLKRFEDHIPGPLAEELMRTFQRFQ